MQRLKGWLRPSMMAAFAVVLLLGFAPFCSFTFTNGAQILRFTLSPWEMLIGKTVDFSAEILGRSPFWGAAFFIIPLFGFIGCFIPRLEVRAVVTAISSIAGSIYIFLCNSFLPDAVFYNRPLEKVFQEHMVPDSAAFGMTIAVNAMWAVYFFAIICAATTFMVFLKELKNAYSSDDNGESYEFEGAVRLEDEEETVFDEIDELEPPLYEDELECYPVQESSDLELELPEEEENVQEKIAETEENPKFEMTVEEEPAEEAEILEDVQSAPITAITENEEVFSEEIQAEEEKRTEEIPEGEESFPEKMQEKELSEKHE